MLRTTLICIALTTLALGAAACGDDDAASPPDDRSEIARVIKLGFVTEDEKVECRLLSDGLVGRIYGSAAKCLEVEKPEKDDEPPTDAPVSNITIAGETATARVRVIGGDSDGGAGTMEMRKEAGEWKVDDFGVDLLRSVLKSALEGELKKDKTFAKPQVRACVTKLIVDLPDARLKRFAYDAVGEKKGSDEEFGRLLTPCLTLAGSGSGSGDQSFVRERFESGLKNSLKGNGMSGASIDCVVKKLRSSITDKEILVLGSSGEPTPKIQRAIVAALTGCGAPADAGGSDSTTQ